MIFELSEKDLSKIERWKKSLPPAVMVTNGGGYDYIFTPTGLGTLFIVKRYDGYELEVWGSEDW
jgi:hypothetical protein